jgi:hypothetical protein
MAGLAVALVVMARRCYASSAIACVNGTDRLRQASKFQTRNRIDGVECSRGVHTDTSISGDGYNEKSLAVNPGCMPCREPSAPDTQNRLIVSVELDSGTQTVRQACELAPKADPARSASFWPIFRHLTCFLPGSRSAPIVTPAEWYISTANQRVPSQIERVNFARRFTALAIIHSCFDRRPHCPYFRCHRSTQSCATRAATCVFAATFSAV